jgi:hypothetical protein
MNADVPPIAADKSLMNCMVAIRVAAGFFPVAIEHVLIDGNRRDIGVHRRPPL